MCLPFSGDPRRLGDLLPVTPNHNPAQAPRQTKAPAMTAPQLPAGQSPVPSTPLLATSGHRNPPRLPPRPQGSSPKSRAPSSASEVRQGVLSPSSPSSFFLPSPTSLVTVPPAPSHPGSALSNVWSPLVYSQRFVECLLHSRPRSGCGGLSSE